MSLSPDLEPEVRLLNAISRTLATQGTPADVMRQSIKVLCPVVGAAYGLVLTLDREARSLSLLAGQGIPDHAIAEMERTFGGTAGAERAEAAFCAAGPVVATTPAAAGLLPDGFVLSELGVGRTVFLPLQLEGLFLLGGVVLCFAEPGDFTEGELRLLWACAEQMAIAFHVALQRQELQEALAHSRELESALKESETRLRAIVDNSQDTITIRSPEGRYLFVNASAAAVVGHTPEELVGRPDTDFFPVEVAELMRQEDRRVMAEGRPIVFERQTPVQDGLRVFEAAKVPLRDASGEIVAVIAMARDVTDRIDRERMLLDQNAKLQELDRLKDHFLSAASHELRTPLSSIMGYAEFLEDQLGGPLTVFQQDYVRNIQTSAEQLQRLVADMLDYARLEAGTFTFSFKLADLFEGIRTTVCRMLPIASKAGMVLDADLPGGDFDLWMDADRVAQVLQNLIGNAIKFTPVGGRIRVEVEPRPDDVIVRVRDSGIGIDPSHLPLIFKRFFQADPSTTRQHGGAGLGLAIAKALVEAHGGQIGVESIIGEGSVFWFTLTRIASGPCSSDPQDPLGD